MTCSAILNRNPRDTYNATSQHSELVTFCHKIRRFCLCGSCSVLLESVTLRRKYCGHTCECGFPLPCQPCILSSLSRLCTLCGRSFLRVGSGSYLGESGSCLLWRCCQNMSKYKWRRSKQQTQATSNPSAYLFLSNTNIARYSNQELYASYYFQHHQDSTITISIATIQILLPWRSKHN